MTEIEMTEEMTTELAKQVAESLNLDEKLKSTAEAAAKAAAEAVLAKFDAPKKKDLGGDEEGEEDVDEVETAAEKMLVKRYFNGDAVVAKKFDTVLKSEYATMSKEKRFFLGIKAVINKDQDTINKLNKFAGELYALKAFQDGRFDDLATKAGYANDAVSADGGALVPDPEFNTTVYENLPKYGVIFSDGNVQNTDRTAVYALSLTGTISFQNVAEAGAIAGTKLAFNRRQVNLVKYAAIIPATTELTEDSIIDYWNIVTNEVARAYGLVSDQQVFTDTTNGILHTAGVITQPLISGGAGTTVAWDDLLSAEGKTEDALDTSDFVWYMRKETFFRLAQTKSTGSGVYLGADMLAGWTANPNQPSTPWGTPIKFTRVLPKTTEVSANGGLAVYGTLKNTNFYNKNGMALTMLDQAAIQDASGSTFNLATQDGVALRAVVRILHNLPTGNTSKFVIVGTGTVS